MWGCASAVSLRSTGRCCEVAARIYHAQLTSTHSVSTCRWQSGCNWQRQRQVQQGGWLLESSACYHNGMRQGCRQRCRWVQTPVKCRARTIRRTVILTARQARGGIAGTSELLFSVTRAVVHGTHEHCYRSPGAAAAISSLPEGLSSQRSAYGATCSAASPAGALGAAAAAAG
jgi:hypothetical protein